ncbi:hypothetical protein STANM309S_06344 [Streptomyces tanashiensis]
MDAADTAALTGGQQDALAAAPAEPLAAPHAAPLTEEQQKIRHTLRDLLAERAGPHENRAATATPEGYDTALWARMTGPLGLAGLALPEEYGGAGRGPAELALACEETGRALAPSPLLAAVLGDQFGQRGALLGHFLGDLEDRPLDVREVLIERRG